MKLFPANWLFWRCIFPSLCWNRAFPHRLCHTMSQPVIMQVWFLMRNSALLFTFWTSQYHCTHLPKLCHEGNLFLHGITTPPLFISPPLGLAAPCSLQLTGWSSPPLSFFCSSWWISASFPCYFYTILSVLRSRNTVLLSAAHQLGDVVSSWLSWKPQRDRSTGNAAAPEAGWGKAAP